MKEVHEVKYIRELQEYYNAYGSALINEIFVGVGIALGLSEKEAYQLIQKQPGKLQKAGFFKNIFEKFKSIFKHPTPKFRPKEGKFGTGKPLTPKQWDSFHKELDVYWKQYADAVTEDMAVKSFMLGRDTTNFRKKKKPYQNKSLYQVEEDRYDGEMPKKIADAYKKYDFTNSEKNALNKSFSNMAMYVTNANTDIKEAIRHQVTKGINESKSPTQIASDLYWHVQKDEELSGKYNAESLRYNWGRIAQYESAAVYEAGILAPYEEAAMESMAGNYRPLYFMFTGGTCKWCTAHHGTPVRMVPTSIITNAANDSLKSMGIKDPNTDIAIWIGKNNVGFRETKTVHGWRVATPAHPHGVATFEPINIETEYFNPKTGHVEERQKKYKHVPRMIEPTYRSKEENEYRKPTFIGNNLVRYNNNVYEAVDKSEADKKLDAWRKDASLPIPVQKDTPQYRRIFGEAT
jgi:hypothetical protein